MRNILFYKFKKLENLEQIRQELFDKCVSLELKGKILIAEEGINGCVSGSEANISEIKKFLTQDRLFGPIEFKQGETDTHTFKKMFVRIRPEIITFKQNIDPEIHAPYIEPKEFKKLLESGEEVILVDARNDYESAIGRFKDAITPQIEIFSELPEKLKELDSIKDKKIVTYCTGGIRCEKSAKWMIQNGFKNVMQLHGGIIRYGDECGNEHWEGKCFVFDRRGAIDIDPKNQNQPITQCVQCWIPCSDYSNCANVDCDKRFIACDNCIKILKHTCSKRCRGFIEAHPQKYAPDNDTKPRQLACNL